MTLRGVDGVTTECEALSLESRSLALVSSLSLSSVLALSLAAAMREREAIFSASA